MYTHTHIYTYTQIIKAEVPNLWVASSPPPQKNEWVFETLKQRGFYYYALRGGCESLKVYRLWSENGWEPLNEETIVTCTRDRQQPENDRWNLCGTSLHRYVTSHPFL